MEPEKKKKLIFICVFVLVVILTEIFYRKPLFNASIEAELELKKCEICINIETYFTLIGSEYSLIILVVFSYFFFPLSKTFAAALTMLTSNYMNSMLKIMIQNPRPWFEKPEILYVNCEGGYGNPSGHAMSSMATFFAIAELFIDRYKPAPKIEVIIYIVTAVIVGNIGLSRIFLGFHSINQILYGFLLGFSVYYFYFHYLKLHQIIPRTLFNEIKIIKNGIIIAVIDLFLLLSVPLTSAIFVDEESEEYQKYYNVIMTSCSKYPVKTYRILDKEGIYGGMTMTSVLGMYFGLYYLIFKCSASFPGKEEHINNFFRNSKQGKKGNLKMIGISIIAMIPMLLFSVISNNAPHFLIYVFKVAFPLLVTTALLFGCVPFVSIHFQLANKSIYSIEEPANGVPGEENINNRNDREENNNINNDLDQVDDNENARLNINNNLNEIKNTDDINKI